MKADQLHSEDKRGFPHLDAIPVMWEFLLVYLE